MDQHIYNHNHHHHHHWSTYVPYLYFDAGGSRGSTFFTRAQAWLLSCTHLIALREFPVSDPARTILQRRPTGAHSYFCSSILCPRGSCPPRKIGTPLFSDDEILRERERESQERVIRERRRERKRERRERC
jgi:hypothetical protein